MHKEKYGDDLVCPECQVKPPEAIFEYKDKFGYCIESNEDNEIRDGV